MDTDQKIIDQSHPAATEQSRPTLHGMAIPMTVIIIPIAAVSLFIILLFSWKVTGSFLIFGYLFEFIYNLAIFSARYIPYHISMLIFLFGVPIFLMIVMNVIYYSLARLKGKLRFVPIALALVITTISAFELRAYRRDCVDCFHRVDAYKGQTLSFEQLQVECGKPAFYREQKNNSHWAYTDGDKVIAVYNTETGEARVSDTAYWLFD